MQTLWALLRALPAGRVAPAETVERTFRVMPWDVGIRTFKSDRYFRVAEAAQLDFVVRTGLLRPLLAGGIAWVNLGQASSLWRPLRLLQAYVVRTRIACIDDKHAYFSHSFASSEGEHAEVLVKAKFKKGSLTMPPQSILGMQSSDKPRAVHALDELLAARARSTP